MTRDALIVGINTYQYLPGLRAPSQDAEAIARQLQTYGEFRVHRLPETIQNGQPQIGIKTQITLRELETALVNLFKPKGSNSPHTALFYFSGHGIQKEAGIQEGYLAVSDSNPDIGFYGLSLFWLRRLLQESPVRQRIIWLDCCHAGELLNFLEADPGAHAGTDRLFMAASREYESAYESLDSPFSVFTQTLLTGLDPKREESGMITNHSLTAWVSHHLSHEIQQPLFENSGGEIILTRCLGIPTRTHATPFSDICPYRGLEFFDEAHAEYFFGREDLTDHLIDRLRTGQFVAVVGASGSGKSSLVRAGLIWELRRGRKFSGSDRWHIKILTPTEHPVKSLAAAFIKPDSSELERAEQLRRAEVFLQDGGAGLAQLVRACLPVDTITTGLQPQLRPRLLLIIDQFEEVFTLCQGHQAERERQQFFSCLIDAANTVGDRLSIVVVLRADFFSKCSLYKNLAQRIEQHLVMVTPLTYEQIKTTIIRPAQKVGLICEPNLVYTMLLDVIGAPGELPLLQYTLLELWQRRHHDSDGEAAHLTLDTYTELGGVRGTLQKRATEIFYSLTQEEQAVARRIFLALTQLGEGTEDTRRRVLKSELVNASFPMALVERTLEKLVAAKLIITSQNRGSWRTSEADNGVAIDVAHEALIRNWSLLRNWLDQNREMLQRRRKIERAAQEWDGTGQLTGAEYLLSGGRLVDAEDFMQIYPQELSVLAQRYVTTSQEENQRARVESRLLQIAVPSVLVVALVITVNQYINTLQTQQEKNYQLQVAASRERAAIAQSILQEPENNPMTALLISRLAVEQGGHTYEAQSSLRAALHNLRLQLELTGHQGAVHDLVFSPDRQHLATAGADGQLRIWAMNPQMLYTADPQPLHTLPWNAATTTTEVPSPPDIIDLAFSPTGDRIAAIARHVPIIKIWSISSGTVITQLTLPQPVQQISFSPDGRWMAAVGEDRTVSVWQVDGVQSHRALSIPGTAQLIRFSADGQFLLTATQDGTIRIWQMGEDPDGLIKPSLIKTITGGTPLADATFSADGQQIATIRQTGRVQLWNRTTGALLKTLRQDYRPSTTIPQQIPTQSAIALSPDQQLMAIVNPHPPDHNGFHSISLWDVRRNRQVGILEGHEGGIETMQFSPDSTYVATAGADGAVRLWTTRMTGELPIPNGATAPVQWLSFVQHPSPINRSLTPILPESTLNGAIALESPSPAIPAIASMVTVTTTGTLQQWQLPTVIASNSEAADQPVINANLLYQGQFDSHNLWQRFLHLIQRAGQSLNSNPISNPLTPNQSVLSRSNQTQSTTLAPVKQQAGLLSNAPLSGFALSPDGRFSATATVDGWVTLQQMVNNQPSQLVYRFQSQSNSINGNPPIRHLTFNADGTYLAGIRGDRIVYIWSVASGQPIQVLQVDPPSVRDAQFSPDGQLLVTASRDGKAQIWQVHSGALVYTLSRQDGVNSAAFSPDGHRIATTGTDGTIRIFDATTGSLQFILTGHQGTVLSARFSPNGRSLVSAGADGTARIWDVSLNIGEELTQLQPTALDGAPIALQDAFFSPDGDYVTTLTTTGQVQLWAATWEALLKLARDRTLRQLTAEECIRYLRPASRHCPQLQQ